MFQTISFTLNFLEALKQLITPGQFGEYQVIRKMVEVNWLLGQTNTVLLLLQRQPLPMSRHFQPEGHSGKPVLRNSVRVLNDLKVSTSTFHLQGSWKSHKAVIPFSKAEQGARVPGLTLAVS